MGNTPRSGIFDYDKEKEATIINLFGIVDFKELFMESLTPELLKLFRENLNLFYSQSFVKGISYEYGILDKSKNVKKALKVYKEAADFKYDYLCMYRMHRIFLADYKYFGLKKNEDLHRLYLYKCFAYLPFSIIYKTYYLLNKIDATNEIDILLDKYEDSKYIIFDKFMDFLKTKKKEFNITNNDIKLMINVFKSYFSYDLIIKDLDCINEFLNFEKGNNTYFEAQLKYCNFYLKYSGEKCDKIKIKNIFENLINAGYYKACFDYGKFLLDEKKYDEAKSIFKKGLDKGEQFCLCEYVSLLLRKTSFNQFLSDYNFVSFLLKNMCLGICIDKLGINSFYYTMYYLSKHSSFKQQIKNDFAKYVIEVFNNEEKYLKIENNESINSNFAKKYAIQIPQLFGTMCYYGVSDIIKSDKDRALIFFKKAYQLAKEKEYIYNKRINYLYIYKCRKYLFKNNRITLRKLNKTKEKLFRMYEETNLDDLDVFELYNYYKLYKITVYGNTQNKLISFLKIGKSEEIIYNFKIVVYKEKCKVALEIEYSNNFSLNQNILILKNEDFDVNDINLCFKTMENRQYNLRVSKKIQFIIAIHKLYSKYPELETKNIGTYVCNGSKICIYDTIEENGLQEGNIIVIINKVNEK